MLYVFKGDITHHVQPIEGGSGPDMVIIEQDQQEYITFKNPRSTKTYKPPREKKFKEHQVNTNKIQGLVNITSYGRIEMISKVTRPEKAIYKEKNQEFGTTPTYKIIPTYTGAIMEEYYFRKEEIDQPLAYFFKKDEDIMNFHQAMQQIQKEEFIREKIKEVNGNCKKKHWRLIPKE